MRLSVQYPNWAWLLVFEIGLGWWAREHQSFQMPQSFMQNLSKSDRFMIFSMAWTISMVWAPFRFFKISHHSVVFQAFLETLQKIRMWAVLAQKMTTKDAPGVTWNMMRDQIGFCANDIMGSFSNEYFRFWQDFKVLDLLPERVHSITTSPDIISIIMCMFIEGIPTPDFNRIVPFLFPSPIYVVQGVRPINGDPFYCLHPIW